MNNLRSSLIKARIGNRSLAANSSIVGATSRVGGVRLSIMQNRAYSSDRPRKGGAGGLKLLTLLGLGGAAGYYYNSTQSFKTKTAPVTETETKSKTAPAAKTEKKNIDYQKVYNDIAEMLDEDPEYDDGSYGPVLFRLAWHCSGTYDKETQTGGSNGATMRFKPEATHSANNGLDIARDLLEKIHQKYPEISYGDLWTLAGVCAVQELGGPTIPWRAGRQDALEASKCTPDGRLPDATKKEDHARDVFHRMGINDREIVALIGGHTLGRCHLDRSGFDGPWQEAPTFFSNEYYKALANRTWIKKNLESGQWQWVDKDNTVVMMLPIELSMYNDKGFKKYYDLYAKDQDVFFKDFAAAFKKLIELGVPFTGDEKVYEFKRTTE